MLSVAKDQGKTYGVPYELRVFGFFYRSDLLGKAKLNPPGSFDELLVTAKRVAGPDQQELGMSFSAGGGSVEAIEWFVPMVIGMGGKILNDDGSAAFNSPQTIDLLGRSQEGGERRQVLPSDVMLSSTDQVEQLAQSGRAVLRRRRVPQEASSLPGDRHRRDGVPGPSFRRPASSRKRRRRRPC